MVFKTTPQLAVDMLRRAVNDGVAPGVVLGDSAYGSSSEFREGVRKLGLDFGVGVDPKTTVWGLDSAERPHGDTVAVRELAHRIHDAGGFRRCTWRKGTNADLSARFAARRVVTAHDDGWARDERERLWLIIEWRDGEDEPANYFLSSLPRRMTRKQLVRVLMQRWRTERVYEDLKGEFGLDHFEGRSFGGWHHHVSVALCCYAFIIAGRVRHFPPSARRMPQDRSFALAA